MTALVEGKFRLVAVCALAFAVSLPIAVINLAKLGVVCAFVWLVATDGVVRQKLVGRQPDFIPLIYLAMVTFLVSVLWSSASGAAIGKSLAQHGNLLVIPLVFFLQRNRRDAAIALQVFMLGQMVLVLGTWGLYLNLPVPWAQAASEGISTRYAVFSSYLDQSIMGAVFAALVWHLREVIPGPIRRFVVPLSIGLVLGAVFGLFIGRTGYVVALVLVTASVFWEMPARWRWAGFSAPVFIGLVVWLAAPQALDRLWLVKTEIAAVAQNSAPVAAETSSGIRLQFWKNSLMALQKSPWTGHGAGSWSSQYDALQPGFGLPGYVPTVGNPHQEYLLWAVELGLPGLALLLAIGFATWRACRPMEPQARRAVQSVLIAIAVAGLFNCALFDALIGDFLCVSLALALGFGLLPPASAGPVARS
ncbi:MAG: O-antigen ligase family protein [Rhodoferax sp.]|nr:O-antigen ligase family protein [Rhodoferax sp.]